MIEISSPSRARPVQAATTPSIRAGFATLASVLALAGCGVPGPEDIVAGSPLAYGVPDPNPASYTFGDTATFVIDAGPMGSLVVRTAQEGNAVLAFREEEAGLGVDVTFPRLHATFSTSSQGEEGADESGLGGPIGLSLEPSGRLVVVDTPAITPRLAEIAGPESLVRPLFVRLPARPVVPGASWVDTLQTSEESGGTRSTGRSVITTTLVGDTVVDGIAVLVLSTVSENTLELTGVSGGVEVEQSLTGRTRGIVLWDPSTTRLVERTEAGELTGTLRMPGVDREPLPVSGTIRRSVRLEPLEPPTPGPSARSGAPARSPLRPRR